MELASAITAWRDCLGDQAVIAAADAQPLYGACTTGVERTIPAALRPRSADEIVAIVDIGLRSGHLQPNTKLVCTEPGLSTTTMYGWPSG